MRGSAMNPSGSFGSLADILQGNRNVRFTPESGPSAVRTMSAKGHKRTSRHLLDHLVGACEQRGVSLHKRQWDFGHRNDTGPLHIRRGDGVAVTDIGVGAFETRLFVVLLLRYHAIEPDYAWTSMRDGRVPYAQSVAAAAHIFPHDVQAKEGEARGVINAGDGRGWSAIEFANEEAIRIYHGKAGGVGEARIPTFGRRSVHGDRDFVRPHAPDAQVAHALTPCSHATVIPISNVQFKVEVRTQVAANSSTNQ